MTSKPPEAPAPPSPADDLDALPELLPADEGQAPDLDSLPELLPVDDAEHEAQDADPDALDSLPELLPVDDAEHEAQDADPDALDSLPELLPVDDAEQEDLSSLPELLPVEEHEEEAEPEEADPADGASWRKLYETTLRDLPRDVRIGRAHVATSEELCALCFDPEPGVILALLENVELRLLHARLIAEHHGHPIGLDALGRRAELVRDTAVRRLLMRNNQASDALLRKALAPLALSQAFRVNTGHESTDRARKVARDVLREKFLRASSEERVTLILRTEGRCLAVLVGVTFDQKMTALLCSRSYQSTLLVQSLARFPALPPVLVAALLKQPLVQRSMPLKRLLLQHKNCPSALKR